MSHGLRRLLYFARSRTVNFKDATTTMTRRASHAFTLIELLVVISIIALLVGILLPALGAARQSAQALVSLSNVRQWGVASMAFTADHRDLIAKDGVDTVRDNFLEDDWWANALPPYVDQERYVDMNKTPMPGDGGIFVDDSAMVDGQVIANGGYPSGSPLRPTYFFCYVPNSKLTEELERQMVARGQLVNAQTLPRIREDQIRKPSTTVLMLEIRTIDTEVPGDDPFYETVNRLNRAKANWKRAAARHREGGHYLFSDGHGDRVDFELATTNRQGTRNPKEPGGDWNTDTLVWNPLAPALD